MKNTLILLLLAILFYNCKNGHSSFSGSELNGDWYLLSDDIDPNTNKYQHIEITFVHDTLLVIYNEFTNDIEEFDIKIKEDSLFVRDQDSLIYGKKGEFVFDSKLFVESKGNLFWISQNNDSIYLEKLLEGECTLRKVKELECTEKEFVNSFFLEMKNCNKAIFLYFKNSPSDTRS